MKKLVLLVVFFAVMAMMIPVSVFSQDTASGTSDVSDKGSNEYKEGDMITPENLDSYQQQYQEEQEQRDNGTPGGKEG